MVDMMGSTRHDNISQSEACRWQYWHERHLSKQMLKKMCTQKNLIMLIMWKLWAFLRNLAVSETAIRVLVDPSD